MNKLISLGELIIDFTSIGNNGLKDTNKFIKNAGGAPGNLCAQVSKLGKEVTYLSAVGNDAFGDFLIETLNNVGVNTKYIKKLDEYDTSLAFVSLNKDGDREFKFYRKNAADLNFVVDDFKEVSFNNGDIFEFGSVALATSKSRDVHAYLINKAKENNCLVCFDPNLRFNLWEDHDLLRRTVVDFLKLSDIVKISDDELSFITNLEKEEDSISYLFNLGVKIILISRGANGATLFTENDRIDNFGYKVKALDTTGSGDSFFGGFIYSLLENNLTLDNLFNYSNYAASLDLACRCGSFTATKLGAIAAMGNLEDVNSL